ncbi:MAG: hypothetical protein LJE59_04025 [Chromatiaceae bacterium]|nr:hypothetical protein [Chromatiaceae bacterium]
MRKSASRTVATMLSAIGSASGLVDAAGFGTTVEIIPTNPRYLEPVYARIDSPISECLYGAQATMTDNVIDISYRMLPELCMYTYDVELGRLPAGDYKVTVRRDSSDCVAATAEFTVAPALQSEAYPGTVPAVNCSDLWWNPSDSGRGISIIQGPTNVLVAVWFIYDQTGRPVWYTLGPGQWNRTDYYSAYSGPIYRTTVPVPC